MSKIGFLTDSCSDIPQELADKYGIEVVGFPINLDGVEYMERKDFTNDQFYQMMRDAQGVPTTAAITQLQFCDIYARYADEGYTDLVYLSINAGGSSTYNNAVKAMELLEEERPGYTMSERTVGRTFNRLFQGCKQRIIVTTFASNVHRIQQIMDAAAECGRKVAVTGRSMENVTKVAMDLGYMKPPKNTVVDINKIKSMPLEKQVIVTTGSQGEEMSALYRMAFSQHKQIEVGPGDRVIISASAIPGNENTVSRVINELFRKGVEVIYDRADMLHVSGHACQEELKIIHALTKPKYFIPVHGEQRMLQLHKDLALQMGMDRKNIVICDNGDAVEIGARSMKCVPGYAPAGEVFVDGYGVGDVGAVVLRDRKHLAEDGMVVVVLPISAQNGDLLAEPEIITRGFIYVKDSEELLQDLRNLTMSTAEAYRGKRGRDLNELKGAIRSAVSNYLFKATKRSPMVLPVITRL